MPIHQPKPHLVHFGARVPPELRSTVRMFAEIRRYDVQYLTEILIESGLKVQFGDDWREQLDQQVPTWQSLKL